MKFLGGLGLLIEGRVIIRESDLVAALTGEGVDDGEVAEGSSFDAAAAAGAPTEVAASEPPSDVGDNGAADDGDESPERGPGRPSLKPNIIAAYRELRDEGKIDFKVPKNRLYGPIRRRVRQARKKPDLKGLGDEAIRLAISRPFEADKKKADVSP